MSNHYFDFDSEKVISLRLQDYDQYPDTSAGKVRTSSNRSRYRTATGSDDYTRSNNSRKNKLNNPERAAKTRSR
ncbi:MAG TPA: hypothetical protein VHE99_00355 [Gammaproteobacteria bacterium]|nr:hypothetical protein [Gammaproteobacteria bacterium]